MRNKIIYLAILFLSKMSLFAQNVSVDNDCLNINSAILGQTIIQQKGEPFISKLLEENRSFLFFIKIDSAGYVKSVENVKSKKNINDNAVKEITSLMMENKMRFYNCYEKPMGYSELDALKMIKKDLLCNHKGLYLINVSFPGDLMNLYNYKKDELSKQGINLSKLEYLKLQIAKYVK